MTKKYNELIKILSSYKSCAVAFSGGVDSAFLLYAAKEALNDKAIAVTAVSSLIPKEEADEAARYCSRLGIKHVKIHPDPLKIKGFADNPPDRCYICKKAVFSQIIETAKKQNIDHVAEGSNLDDNNDHRPGHRAIEELGISSPLREAGFDKAAIRKLSEKLGISCWNKPSSACLASRIPYGDLITEDKLHMIELAEAELKKYSFSQYRVRIHGSVARIELQPDEMNLIMKEDLRIKIHERFRDIGFKYISLDLLGYRTGSLNELL